MWLECVFFEGSITMIFNWVARLKSIGLSPLAPINELLKAFAYLSTSFDESFSGSIVTRRTCLSVKSKPLDANLEYKFLINESF